MKLTFVILALFLSACASTSRNPASSITQEDQTVGISVCDNQNQAWECKELAP